VRRKTREAASDEKGIDGLKNHAWYTDFDWAALSDGSMVPPYMPALNGPKDISNFAQHQFDKAPEAEYDDDFTQWDREFAPMAERAQNFMYGGAMEHHVSERGTGDTLQSADTRPDIGD